MAITSVAEIHQGRSGKQDAIGGSVEHNRVYRVWTDSNLTESEDVLNDSRIPALGTLYPWNASAWLQDRDASNNDESKKLWTVTCRYSSKMPGAGGGQRQENPLNEIAKISFSSEEYEYNVGVTRSGLPIVNSAGSPFEAPPVVQKHRRVWTIQRNIPSPSFAGWDALGTLNSSIVILEGNQGVIAAQEGLLTSIAVSEWKERNKYVYYTVSLKIIGPKTHNDGRVSHDIETLDQGLRCLSDPATLPDDSEWAGLHEQARDETGEPVKSPVLLDGSGRQLSTFSNYVVYLYWPVYPLSSWSGVVPGIL